MTRMAPDSEPARGWPPGGAGQSTRRGRRRRLVVLGATGSVGQSALAVADTLAEIAQDELRRAPSVGRELFLHESIQRLAQLFDLPFGNQGVG